MKLKWPKITVFKAIKIPLKRIPPKSGLFLGRNNQTICSGPPPVAEGTHVHAYGYTEPYGYIYKCGINDCNSPIELVILHK